MSPGNIIRNLRKPKRTFRFLFEGFCWWHVFHVKKQMKAYCFSMNLQLIKREYCREDFFNEKLTSPHDFFKFGTCRFAMCFASVPFTVDNRWRRELYRVCLPCLRNREKIRHDAHLRATDGQQMVFGVKQETDIYFQDLMRTWGWWRQSQFSLIYCSHFGIPIREK